MSSAERLAERLSGGQDSDTQKSTPVDQVELSRVSRLVRETIGEDWSRADLDDALDGFAGTDTGLRRAVVERIVNPNAGRVRGKVRTGDTSSGRSAPRSSAERLLGR